MLITLDKVLAQDDVQRFRQRLDSADWRSGSATAGTLARSVKQNEQLDDASDVAVELGQHLLRVLGRHPTFIAATLPRKIHPPKFNRYADGGTYGAHVDSAVMQWPGTQQSMRTDVSATLFLADPHEYDGGALEIEGPFGVQGVKLEAGDLVLYPSSSLHRVTPVTRGARIASFFWIESLVQDEGDRTLLFDLDQAIQRLTPSLDAADPRLLQLTGVYHNLLRRWAQT
ncbi:Fe2+-dependent dioxygenase [Paracidovorax valerianellae]|uniref:PKHD-type hydroxylase n=1 Tax=Paracidovorax valerianellae TaxID=187868 RepID=A0A1G7F2P1_9BURK|nr:Fe2+-dependent dioxygenase [Paracidovorax valerianellae]MDA8445163.1 Fe2+-dependent dioxygenase [Paracidovorax valerianellae]SDE70167.1 PKHD-type hydroxylase [Paracidovorax valerianellae]